MSGRVVRATESLRAALGDFDPAVLSGADAAAVVVALARTEKACAAARARAAARAVACGAHRRAGFVDGAEWLARETGCGTGEARAAMATAQGLDNCPATAQALAAGQVSLHQAAEIAHTVADVPGSEAEMLALAQTTSLGALRDEGRRRRLSAVDPDELARRQHAARECRHWRDSTGMVRLSAALAPAVGIALVNRLDAECDRLRRAARAQGNTESRPAHGADALVALCGGGSGSARPGRAEVVFVCEICAACRGHAHPGEPCQILGGGPVPVREVAKVLEGGQAFVKAVLHDGVAVQAVAHYGRHIPAEVRTALHLGDPPDFDGAICDAPGCGRRYGLEWDHIDPVANGGPTSLGNLRPLCWPHHAQKTQQDRQSGRLGPRAP